MITPDVLPLPFLIRMTPQLQPPPAAAPVAEPITHPLFGVDPNAGQQQQQPPMMGGMMPQQHHHHQEQQQPGGYGVSKGIFTSLYSSLYLQFSSCSGSATLDGRFNSWNSAIDTCGTTPGPAAAPTATVWPVHAATAGPNGNESTVPAAATDGLYEPSRGNGKHPDTDPRASCCSTATPTKGATARGVCLPADCVQ